MDRKLINPAIVQDIADAIREKGGQTEPIVVNALGDAIRALPQGMGDNTTEVVSAISGEQPEGDVEIANAIAKGATDAAREHVWQGERATDEGRELRDGVAFVSALRGKSFKMSQNIQNGNFERGIYAWNGAGSCTIAVDENGLKATLSIDATSSYTGYVVATSFGAIQGHKYLVIVSVTCDKSGSFLCDTNGVIATSVNPVTANVRTIVHAIGTCASSQIKSLALYPSEKIDGYKAGDSFTIHYAMVFDLTAMGMEDVVDADDFAHRLGFADAASLPYIQYGEQIINSKPTEVVSRGRNLLASADEILEAKGWIKNEDGSYTGAISYLLQLCDSKGGIFKNVIGDGTKVLTIGCDFSFGFETALYVGFLYADGTRTMRYITAQSGRVTCTSEGGKIIAGVRFSYGTNTDVTLSNLMLEYGSEATPFVPYLLSTLPLPLSSIIHEGQPLFPQGLCGIENVKDEVDWAKGKASRKILNVNVSESPRIFLQSINSYGIANFGLYVDGVNGLLTSRYCLCNYGEQQFSAIADTKEEGWLISSYTAATKTQLFYFRVLSSKANSIATFRSYLASNPAFILISVVDPIEVTFDPAKAFYKVQNGGTEEAVMDGLSAPLVADIAYRDNMAYSEEAALLAFANERSGQNDADLGDAIRTLSE